jgi:hypothetical protein
VIAIPKLVCVSVLVRDVIDSASIHNVMDWIGSGQTRDLT